LSAQIALGSCHKQGWSWLRTLEWFDNIYSADNVVKVSGGAGALAFGGGVRIYLTRHFGISAGVQVLDFVSGGGTVIMPTAGLFAQSK
jgi:hypothetical protein